MVPTIAFGAPAGGVGAGGVSITVWKPSEKCDGACTGKRAWVNPVIAPSRLGGVPPSSCARSSTEATYACEWL